MKRHLSFPQRAVGAFGVVLCLTVGTTGAASRSQTSSEPALIPGNATALEGLPAVRLDATKEGATRRTLDRAEAFKQSLRIRILNGRYYWESREDQPLTLSSSGEFTYLSSTEPGRYVRFRRLNDRITYVEHVDVPSGSVTYWGELRIVLGQ